MLPHQRKGYVVPGSGRPFHAWSMMMTTTMMMLLHCAKQASAVALTMDLEAGDRDCVMFRSPDVAGNARGTYEMLDDEIDVSYISAWIVDYSVTKTVWSSETDGVQEGGDGDRITFDVPVDANKRYEICFENRAGMDDEDEEDFDIPLGFSIRVHPSRERTLSEEEEGPDAIRALAMVDIATKLENDWENLNDHFDFMRNREVTHFRVTEGIFHRVMMWTCVESGLVVFMAIAQVLYWRKFFEQRRYL